MRSGSLVVDVVVADINDNRPAFEHSVYDTQITENVDPSVYQPALLTVQVGDFPQRCRALYPVYTIEQTASKRRANIELAQTGLEPHLLTQM